MMYNYPFFSFPTFRNYNYYPNNAYNKNTFERGNTNKTNHSITPSNNTLKLKEVKKEFSKNHISRSDILVSKKEKNEPNALFEVFGIKLYFDDILLISLIFFLYNEGVKDDYLFITLILLLLS